MRTGIFRSLFDDERSFSHLLVDVTEDGGARRLLIADAPFKNASTSGELRITRDVVEGPHAHSVHLSLRARDRARRYDGAQLIDFGLTTITSPAPATAPVLSLDMTASHSGVVVAAVEVKIWVGTSTTLSRLTVRKVRAKPHGLPVHLDMMVERICGAGRNATHRIVI